VFATIAIGEKRNS